MAKARAEAQGRIFNNEEEKKNFEIDGSSNDEEDEEISLESNEEEDSVNMGDLNGSSDKDSNANSDSEYTSEVEDGDGSTKDH